MARIRPVSSWREWSSPRRGATSRQRSRTCKRPPGTPHLSATPDLSEGSAMTRVSFHHHHHHHHHHHCDSSDGEQDTQQQTPEQCDTMANEPPQEAPTASSNAPAPDAGTSP